MSERAPETETPPTKPMLMPVTLRNVQRLLTELHGDAVTNVAPTPIRHRKEDR